MSLFVVLLGGELVVTARLKRQIEGARVIAADSGIRHARALNLSVEAWLGDFDSSDSSLAQLYSDVPRMTFSVEKSMTDGELAVEEAIRRGATTLILVGALGGERSDHAMLHATLMLALIERGIDVFLTSGSEEAWPLQRQAHPLDLPIGTIVSIVGFDDLRELCIEGVKWPLTDHDVAFGSSLTLSNEVSGPFKATVNHGRAVIFINLSMD